MSRPWSVGVAIVLAVSALAAGSPGSRPAIEEIVTDVRGGTLSASFHLVNSLDEETLERIHSGIPVTYKHRIELVGRRPYWISARRVEGRVQLETRVEYDPLVKRYTLWRRLSRSARGKKVRPSPPEERITSSEQEMRRFLTRIEPVSLIEPGRDVPAGKLKLKISSNLGRRYVMMIFPGNHTVSAERQLEFDGTR